MNTSLAMLLVITSGLLHAIWNLFAKKSLDKTAFLWWLQLVAVLVYIPAALTAIYQQHVPLHGYLLLFVTAIIHGLYVMLLAKTYTLGDLSHVYPFMRGMSPLMVPMIGVILLGEHLPVLGWLGVFAILSGIWSLSGWNRRLGNPWTPRRNSNHAIRWAFCVGIAVTCYTAFDKVALHYIPAATLTDACNFGNLLALTWWALKSGGLKREWHINWKPIIIGGIISPGGYLLFLIALHFLPVAQLAPMREIGTVFGTILGITVLKEQQGRRRVGASILIAAGVMILGMIG